MTEDKLRALFKLWQQRLGLDLWTITPRIIEFEAITSIMRCRKSINYTVAEIQVQPWVLTMKPPDESIYNNMNEMTIEKSVVHELLHCVLQPIEKAQEIVEEIMGDSSAAWTAMDKSFEQAQEATVDALAVALVRAFGQK